MMFEVKISGDAPPGSGKERMASIQIDGHTIFSEYVYDNPENTAEQNIVLLFTESLRRTLERD